MAYTKQEKEKIFQKAIKAAKDKELIFLQDTFAFLPISSQTFYNWGFDKVDELKEVIENNKIAIKIKLRRKMYVSNNATLIIALYKLVANDREREILADNKTIKLEDMPEIKINLKE